MIFEYAGRIHNVPIEMTNLSDKEKHWLVFELPTQDEIVRQLIGLSDPEAEACLNLLYGTNQKDKAEQFKSEVYMCCYYIWRTPYGRVRTLKRQKHTSSDLAQKIETYARNRGWKPDVISPVAWDVAASCWYYKPTKAKWTTYRVYPQFNQTRFPV